jgi:hypothetical protein
MSNLPRNLIDRTSAAVGQARRLTAGSALVRFTTGLAALGALALAMPLEEIGEGVVLFLPIAIGVAVFPRTRWVSLVALLAIVGWLFTTVVFGAPVTPWRLGGLAVTLYVMHSGATLAAVLPFDCLVAPRTVLRWLGRTVAVLGASLAIGLGGLLAASVIPSTRSTYGPIVGSAVAAALAFLLVWHLRRRA